MMPKSLYDENARYIDEAFAILGELQPVLQSLFARYMAQGYSPREIAHILITAVMDTEMEMLLSREVPPIRVQESINEVSGKEAE